MARDTKTSPRACKISQRFKMATRLNPLKGQLSPVIVKAVKEIGFLSNRHMKEIHALFHNQV